MICLMVFILFIGFGGRLVDIGLREQMKMGGEREREGMVVWKGRDEDKYRREVRGG